MNTRQQAAWQHRTPDVSAEDTRQREKEIRQVENEITLLEGWDPEEFNEYGKASWRRIIAREQAALAELKRGWKD